MKKRLLSACTALLCLAQIPALSVSAVSMEEAAWNVFPNYSYTETADGRAFCEDLGFRMQGFLVITDGTELTAEHLGTLPDSEWYDWTLTELDFVPSAIGCDGVRCYQVYPKKKAGYAEYESLPHPVFAQCGKQLTPYAGFSGAGMLGLALRLVEADRKSRNILKARSKA